MDHIFLCIRYTSHEVHPEVTEIAAVRTNGYFSAVRPNTAIAAFTTKVQPKVCHIDIQEGEKHYNVLEWKNAPDFRVAINQLKKSILRESFSHKYVVVTQYLEITKSILRRDCQSVGEELFPSERAWLDINQLVWPLVVNHLIDNRKLETLAQYLNIPYQNTDTADVCSVLVHVYNALMRRYKTALIGEEAMRDFGGETLQKLRDMVGF